MTIREVVDRYIEWRRALGSKFECSAHILHRFCRYVGENISCDVVTEAHVRAFVEGKGPWTAYGAAKYHTLSPFYRYAASRGYVTSSPMPDVRRKWPDTPPPYIYSHAELQRLFGAISRSRRHATQLDEHTFRTLLLLLYGAALRLGEALRLTLEDVDLSNAVLTVRDTKFYKSRLVPVGPQLTQVLSDYAERRADRPAHEGKDSTYLANRDGTPVSGSTVQSAFTNLRNAVGIHRRADTGQRPYLHSFRHSFAVHRLTSWYREGADVQRLLPVLSTYLGHADLDGTQVYLSMTPELLQEASLKLERYLGGTSDE